jgi:hypothetical protein
VENLKCAPPALSANIRLGWKGLPETNTPAYYNKKLFTDKTVLKLRALVPVS